jgi:hypothetical protein
MSDPGSAGQDDPIREGSSPALDRQILVPDASVGVKWFVQEPDAESAARLLDSQWDLYTPSYYNGVHGGPLDHLVLWVTDDLALPN